MPVDQLRSAHYLRKSRAVGFPKLSIALSVVCSSTEVEGLQRERDTKLLAWSAAGWRQYAESSTSELTGSGTDAPSFWRWLAQVRAGFPSTWLWQLGAGHGCTTLGLWSALERGLWALDGADPADGKNIHGAASQGMRGLCVLQEPPFILLAKAAHEKGIVKWVDVRNLGVDAWQEIYSDCGVESPEGTISSDPDIVARTIADVRAVALKVWLQEWYAAVADLNLGGLRHTAAAQAWHGWRHSYLEGPLLVHANQAAISLERESIHPGRNECYRVGRITDPVYHLDASAFYPGIAARNQLPGRLRGSMECDLRRAQSLASMGWLVIGSGYVNTREPLAPYRVGDATIYPIGSFPVTLCWPEWDLLSRSGAECTIHSVSYYDPAQPCRRFSERLWRYRLDCERDRKRARARCVKRLMNSLIGKFAAWDWGWVDTPGIGSGYPYSCWYQRDAESGKLERWRSIGWHVQKEECKGEAPDSCPAIASWVYSLGRVRMAEWIATAGRGNCLYTDTDSLYCTVQGYEPLVAAGEVQDKQMGCLSLRKILPGMEIWGLKSYATVDGIVCAGVSEGARIQSDGGFEFWHPEKIGASLRDKRAPRDVMLRYRVPENRPYRHGIVQADGTVKPHVVHDGVISVDSDL